jgi:hypothetical protein
VGFSNLLGAGRLRLRHYGNNGINRPGGYRTGSGCLGEPDSHILPINNGAALPAGVDYIKVVTWWYDHDHDEAPDPGNPALGSHDWYELSIQRFNSSTAAWETVVNDDSHDNRQRVFFTGDGMAAGGDVFRVKIKGIKVEGSMEGCGIDRNRIYYAMIWEDNARDDGGDNSTFVRPHSGVLP